MSDVEIYTDGACRGNPGPGGWGALLRAGQREKELYGGEKTRSFNRAYLWRRLAWRVQLKTTPWPYDVDLLISHPEGIAAVWPVSARILSNHTPVRRPFSCSKDLGAW